MLFASMSQRESVCIELMRLSCDPSSKPLTSSAEPLPIRCLEEREDVFATGSFEVAHEVDRSPDGFAIGAILTFQPASAREIASRQELGNIARRYFASIHCFQCAHRMNAVAQQVHYHYILRRNWKNAHHLDISKIDSQDSDVITRGARTQKGKSKHDDVVRAPNENHLINGAKSIVCGITKCA